MLTKRIGCLVTALCFVVASGAVACDKHKSGTSAKVAKMTQAKSGCNKSKTQTVAAKSDKPCCSKSNAKTVAAKTEKSGCNKSKATTVAAKSDKPCCSKGKAATVAAKTEKSGCSKSKKATVASAGSKPSCSKGKSATVAAMAKDKKGGCSKPCGGKSATTVASAPSIQCPMARKKVESVLASMPSMKYKVGDMTTCCEQTASMKAAESGTKMAYVVDGKEYHCREEASAVVAKMMGKKMGEMMTVAYVAGGKEYHCPKSATMAAKDGKSSMMYRVAGFDFSCKDKAQSVVAKAEAAAKAVTVSMTADGKPCQCAHSAKASGKTVMYHVGEEATSSESIAQMMRQQVAARTFVETVAASL